MSRMAVKSEVEIYEIDGLDVPISEYKKLVVESHWNVSDRVVLVFGKKQLTVNVRELRRAIDNATNCGD